MEKRIEIIKLIDKALTNELGLILLNTQFSDQMRLVRWKIRRYFEGLAREFSLEIPKTDISIKALELANPAATAGTNGADE